MAALLHSSQVVGVRQTLLRWTEGATYVRQGDHHVGHWPTDFLYGVLSVAPFCVQKSMPADLFQPAYKLNIRLYFEL